MVKNNLTQQITEARKEQTCAQSLTDQLDTENQARIKDLKGAQTTAEQGEQLERATQDQCRIVTVATALLPDQSLRGAMENNILIPRTPWYVQQQSTITSSSTAFTQVPNGGCTRIAGHTYFWVTGAADTSKRVPWRELNWEALGRTHFWLMKRLKKRL